MPKAIKQMMLLKLPSCDWYLKDIHSTGQLTNLLNAVKKDHPSKRALQYIQMKIDELHKTKKVTKIIIWQPKTMFRY